MASSSLDALTGHPVFADGDAPDVAYNPTEVAAFAASVGTRKIGTTAERNAFAYGREGFEWRDTSLDRTYIHDGSGWVPVKSVQSGTHTIVTVGTGGSSAPLYWSGLQTVTFPIPFSAAPKVTVSAFGTYVGFGQVNAVTATSFTYRLVRIDSVPVAGNEVMWIAQES